MVAYHRRRLYCLIRITIRIMLGRLNAHIDGLPYATLRGNVHWGRMANSWLDLAGRVEVDGHQHPACDRTAIAHRGPKAPALDRALRFSIQIA